MPGILTIVVSEDPAECAVCYVPREMNKREAAHALHQAWAAVDAECNDMVVELSEPIPGV